MQGRVQSRKVVELDRYCPKEWSTYERGLINRALFILKLRGDDHFAEYFTDDQGNAIVAFTMGYHVDATYSVSKVNGRYVTLRYDGTCVADTKTLAEALALALYGGTREPRWYFFRGAEMVEKALQESLHGSSQA